MSTSGSYEFSESENRTFSGIALAAQSWGLLSVLTGVPLALLGSQSYAVLVCGVGVCFIGIAFWRAGRSLRSVVETEGDDITHAIAGLHQLTRAFRIQVGCSFGMVLVVGWHVFFA